MLGSSCSRDHSALEQDPTATGGGGATSASSIADVTGATEASASGTASTGGGAGASQSGSGAGGEANEGGARPIEPDGPTRIVVVHGLTDRDRVAFCFASASGEGLPVAPFPEGGLDFAGVADLDLDVLPASSDAVVVLVSGPAGDLAGASCDALLAEPAETPELEVAALGVVPAEALEAPRILVLCATGCLGGEDHENELMEQACGVGYGPFAPTASLVAVSPSRLAPPDKLGVQSIGASLAAGPLDVHLRPGNDGTPFRVTSGLSWGASAPYPPYHERNEVYVGLPSQLSAFVTLAGQDEPSLAEIDLADAADRAGFSVFDDGEAISIVFVGAAPGLGEGPWWHAFDALLIPADPED